MKADPFAQLKLLDVQTLDTRADTIAHRLQTLPEAMQLRELADRHRAAQDRVRDLQVSVSDLTAEQKRADADVEQVKTRRDRDQGLIDSGSVGDPKALERMVGELESLARRISALEDAELDVMERLETAQTELGSARDEEASLAAEGEQLRATVTDLTSSLEAERSGVRAERETLASAVPDDLLALYERIREHKGGVGAALLRARRCEGCNLSLDNSVLGEIGRAAEDEVVRCEECDRILIRTDESGL